MAEKTIFQEFIQPVMPKLGLYIKERENGRNEADRTYLHEQRLLKVYSPDQKWEGTSSNNKYVKADYVAFDSPLPIKSRGQMKTSNGRLPKIGVRYDMSETDINNVNIMKAQLSMLNNGSQEYISKRRNIINKLFDDITHSVVAIREQNEYVYQYGISNGVVLVQADKNDAENIGLGLRVDYGYKAANILRPAVKDNVDADDLQRVLDKVNADGNSIAVAMVSKSLLTRIRRTRWAREFVADYDEKIYDEKTKLPVPSEKKFKDAFSEEYGFGFIVVDRTVLCEKNGVNVPVKPFNQNRIIFLPNASTDGSLVWSDLAEKTNPAENVYYNTVDDFTLVSRLRVTDPAFAEVTKAQAMVLPVIEDVDAIYVLDFSSSSEVDPSDATVEGEVDDRITIEGKVYKKEDVISAMKALGSDIKANANDSTVIRKFNELSDADQKTLMDGIKDSVI